MKKEKKESGEEACTHLRLIYDYYCKLNYRKLKHKNFDDVGEKTHVMDLHEFMTFCKDFHLIAQRKKAQMKTEANEVQPPP